MSSQRCWLMQGISLRRDSDIPEKDDVEVGAVPYLTSAGEHWQLNLDIFILAH
jgi:hypothetical protein